MFLQICHFLFSSIDFCSWVKVFTSILKDYCWTISLAMGIHTSTSIKNGFFDHVSSFGSMSIHKKRCQVSPMFSHLLWLDLCHVFGSVDHNLIHFALLHYYYDMHLHGW